jgi:hypothetical protein
MSTLRHTTTSASPAFRVAGHRTEARDLAVV